MKSTLILVALLGTAAAEPTASKPKPTECKASGTPIFEIDVETGKDTVALTKIFATGAWTKQRFDDKHKATLSTGCLETAQLDDVVAAIKAPWNVTHPKMRCMAVSATHTLYKIRGKQVYNATLCGPDELDAKATQALAKIMAALKGLPPDVESTTAPPTK
jgi:hypothetical protein